MADARIRAVITAEDRASATLGRFGNQVDTVGNKISRSMKIAAVAAAGASAALLKFSLDQFRDIQKNVAGIQALTKNTAEAKRVLKDAIEFVQGKPFDRLDTIGAAKQLLAFGRTAKDVKGDLDILGRTVLISGIDWQNLTRVYGRVISSGKLLREDFNILNDAGVGLAKTLQKNLGLSMEEVFEKMSDGEISAKDFKKALEDAAPSSAITRSLNTFDNRMLSLRSSIRDVGFAILGVDFNQLDEKGRPLVRPGGLLDRLQTGMEGLTVKIRSIDFRPIIDGFMAWARQVAENLGPKIEELMPKLRDFATNILFPLSVMFGQTLVAAAGLFLDVLNAVMPVINSNRGLILGLILAYAALKTAMFLNGVVQAFTGVMVAVRAQAVATAGMSGIGAVNSQVKTMQLLLASPLVVKVSVAAAMVVLGIMYNRLVEIANLMQSLDQKREANIRSARDRVVNAKNKAERDAALRELYKAGNVPKLGRQLGGRVQAGQAYTVGEAGPERFVPSENGEIVPNHKMGGSPINIIIQAQAFMGSRQEGRKFAQIIAENLKDIASSKNMTLNEMLS